MRRKLCLLLSLCLLSLLCGAQNSKQVKALQKQKQELQKTLKKSQTELSRNKQQVKTGQQNIRIIGQQLEDRLQHIHQLEDELDQLDSTIARMQTEIDQLNTELQVKRQKLKEAMRYARAQRHKASPLLFVLSARTVRQMYRRARYAKEYAAYEKNLGEQIQAKQAELLDKQNQMLAGKSRKNNVLLTVMSERKQLNTQQVTETRNVANLKKQQAGIAGKIAQQQKQLTSLDKKIHAHNANEIEQARKRAEEAARKKALAEEAARKKKAAAEEAARLKAQEKAGSKTVAKSAGKSATPSGKSATTTTSSKPQTWLTAEDRQLNGTFEQNKGRLPVPITGQYMLGNRFGMYSVAGLSNVVLDSKGTNYVGKSGAKARSVFDGVVSAVFQFAGTKNILIRHGSYISVYCNLSSVSVSKGQKVHTRDIIGTVADDGGGKAVLHFQLRKETAKLNPEAWIGR